MIAVVLALGIYMYFGRKGAGSLRAEKMHPSFRVYLENSSSGYMKEEISGRILWIDAFSEKKTVLLKAGKAFGLIRVTLPEDLAHSLRVGAHVTVKGTLFLYEDATNPGQFSYRDYYDALGFYLCMTGEEIVNTENASGKLFFAEIIYRLSLRISSLIDENFSEEDGAFLKNILLSEDGDLSEDRKSIYRDSGLLRILKLTGIHLSLLGSFLFSFFRKRFRHLYQAVCLTSAFFLPFIFLSGFSLSVIRAYIVLNVRMTAALFKRKFDYLNGGALSAVLLMLAHPLCIYLSGIQYFFSVMLGVGLLLPAINLYLKKYRPFWSFVISYFCIQCVLLPVQLHFTGVTSLYGFITQLLFSAVFLLLYMTGIFACVLYGASDVLTVDLRKFLSFLADVFSGFIHGMRLVFEWLSKLILKLPGGYFIRGCPGKIRIVVYVFLIFLLFFLYRYLFEKRKYLSEKKERPVKKETYVITAGLLLFTYVFGLFFLKAAPVKKENVQLIMMDVGQGDGFLIRTGDGMNILIDCGSTSDDNIGENVLIPLLEYYGIRKLSGVFVSHNDTDHISGILNLMENSHIRIERFYLPDHSEMRESILYETALSSDITVDFISKGSSVSFNELSFSCLWPSKKDASVKGNDISLVLLMSFGAFDGLFTGDIGGEYETVPQLKDIDLLKVSHHGSKYSTGESFLSLVKPEAALISCGLHNNYGHPADETLERLSKAGAIVYRTDNLGAIGINIHKNGAMAFSLLAN